MRAKSLCALLIVQCAHASPYVDPTAIEAEAPEMLEPTAFHTFCGPSDFVVSLDPAKPSRANGQVDGSELKHALDDQGGTKTVTCKQGNQEIVATFDITPPGEQGFCGAVHHVKVRVRVDNQMLVTSKFADYCTLWGVTSITLLGRGSASPAATLRVCGYWQGQVAVRNGKDALDKRHFECSDFPAQEMLTRKLYVSDSPNEIYTL